MNSIVIRKILPSHSGRLHTLFIYALQADFAYFSPEYRRNVAKQNNRMRLTVGSLHPKRLFLGVFNQGELVGYSITGLHEHQGFLYWLFVSPSLRGQKLGKQLLQTTEEHAKARSVDSLSLVTHNHESFYQAHGYQTLDTFTDSLSGVDMSKMQKELV